MAASKKSGQFRDWLNIPFHYFKVSLVVWKPERSNSLRGYPDISALGSYLVPFCDSEATCSGISRAEGLAARAGRVLLGHLQPTPQPWQGCCWWGWAGTGPLFAHPLPPGDHTEVDCRAHIVMVLLCELNATWVYSRTWEYSGHNAVRCGLGLSNLLTTVRHRLDIQPGERFGDQYLRIMMMII